MEKVFLKGMFVLVLSAVLLGACKKDKTTQNRNEKKSFVQFINAAPKSGDFEIIADNIKLPGKIPYLNQGGYVSLTPKNNIPFKITSSNIVVAEGRHSFVQDKYYSVFVYDTLMAVRKIKYLLLKDSFPNTGIGRANIRFLHFAPDAPAVSIDLIKGTDSVRVTTAATYIGKDSTSPAALGNFSGLAIGDYQVKTKLKGRNNADSLVSVTPLKIDAGKAYTLFLTGLVKGTEQHKLELRILKQPN